VGVGFEKWLWARKWTPERFLREGVDEIHAQSLMADAD
jgi:hypothetical protein